MQDSNLEMLENSAVRREYQRWIERIGPYDPYLTKLNIGIHEVLQAHFLLVDYFFKINEGIGGVGPKDINLLHSALSRQFTQFGGKAKWSDRIDVCSTLVFGLVKNHPFFDANKRTAFLVSLLHLQKIGRVPTVGNKEYEDFIVDIAEENMRKYHWYDRTDGPEQDRQILTISRFLKRHTREIDLRQKTITYREMNTLLVSRGFELVNPIGNRIDLVKIDDALRQNRGYHPKRIAHIGFHGWTKQVSLKDVNIIREASKLDARHGYDSQSFFNGMEDPLSLIKKYKDPLERLAYR
ncbi:MAG: type II toxin-antitoxin system death-on-curing family toxin [Rhizobiaceae bacterium]|nr:type II toxin-antitoxin system death-on-curing family toxin [Rhizobiaceae bacterium]